MPHNTLIGGTSYEITGGRTLVGGTGYDVTGGRTRVRGTGYTISFIQPKYAMLYSDGSFVFQEGDNVASGNTLTASYTGFEDSQRTRPLWDGKQNTFTSVSFDTEITPTSMSDWFYNSCNLVADVSMFSNLNMKKVINMSCTYYNCRNLIGSPICGPNVTNMGMTYYDCRNLKGSPVCGDNVTSMSATYADCYNLAGPLYAGLT